MFCGKCGEQNPDGNTFCGKCGAKIETIPVVEVPEEVTLKPTVKCFRCGKPNPEGSTSCAWCSAKIKNSYKESVGQSANFNPTKTIGRYIQFDEINRLFLISDGIFKKKNSIYSFDDIVEYELLVDGATVTKGGLGRAVVGGALFGGVGAIVGGVTGGKKATAMTNKMQIKITVNNFQQPSVYITLIFAPTKTDSYVYKNAYKTAQEILSTFSLIQRQN